MVQPQPPMIIKTNQSPVQSAQCPAGCAYLIVKSTPTDKYQTLRSAPRPGEHKSCDRPSIRSATGGIHLIQGTVSKNSVAILCLCRKTQPSSVRAGAANDTGSAVYNLNRSRVSKTRAPKGSFCFAAPVQSRQFLRVSWVPSATFRPRKCRRVRERALARHHNCPGRKTKPYG